MNQLENFNNLSYYLKVFAILFIILILLKFVINLNWAESILLSCIIAVSILIIENIIFINNSSTDPISCNECVLTPTTQIKNDIDPKKIIVLPENEQKSILIKPNENENFTSIDSNDDGYEYKCYRTPKINNLEYFTNLDSDKIVNQEFDQFINNQSEQNNKLLNNQITSEDNNMISTTMTPSLITTTMSPSPMTSTETTPIPITMSSNETTPVPIIMETTMTPSISLPETTPVPITMAPTMSTATMAPTMSTTTMAPTMAPTMSTTTMAPTMSTTTMAPTMSTATMAPTMSTATMAPTMSTTTMAPSKSASEKLSVKSETSSKRFEDIVNQPKGGDTYDVNSVHYQQDGIQDEERRKSMETNLFRMSEGNRKVVDKYLSAGGKYYGDILTRSTNAPSRFEAAKDELKYGDFNYVGPLNKGMINPEYTFVSPSNWYPIPPHPPVCVTNKSCTTCPIMMSDGKDYMQFASLDDFDKSRRFTGDMGINIDYVKNILNNPDGY